MRATAVRAVGHGLADTEGVPMASTRARLKVSELAKSRAGKRFGRLLDPQHARSVRGSFNIASASNSRLSASEIFTRRRLDDVVLVTLRPGIHDHARAEERCTLAARHAGAPKKRGRPDRRAADCDGTILAA